jgi:hypothetical protein
MRVQSFNEMFSSFPQHPSSQDLGIAPLDPLNDLSLDASVITFDPNDPAAWLPTEYNTSQSSSPYSGSPAPSDMSLPMAAPQPQHAGSPWQWQDSSSQLHDVSSKDVDSVLGFDGQQMAEPQLGGYAAGIEGLFPPFGTVDTHGAPIMGFEYNY